MTYSAAINQSITENKTIILNYDKKSQEALDNIAEIKVTKDSNTIEYWGTDDNGNEWSIHMEAQ